MFEDLFTLPWVLKKHLAAPFAAERLRYLAHLRNTGARRTTLLNYAYALLRVVELLKNLSAGGPVSMRQIEAAAADWARPRGRSSRGRSCVCQASRKAKALFTSRAVRWFEFLGWMEAVEQPRHSGGAEIAEFEAWLRSDRGLSNATIDSYCVAADRFFVCLARRDISLASVKITDIDDAFVSEKARGALSRRSIHDYAQRLRAFIRFSEARGWCAQGLAAGIMAPRFMRDEGVPRGRKRDEVVRLLAATQGDRPSEKRDRAILMLFVAYGLRAGEVAGLQLDDLDGENEILRVRCPKPGRTQSYPLSRGVAQAIVDYIRDVRPSGFGRSLFFRLSAPIRPLTRKALGKIVSDRLSAIGIVSGPRGTHALRHATAQHLLDQGVAMKVIGDLLGHRDASSTTIYAKVDLNTLREVGNFDLGALV